MGAQAVRLTNIDIDNALNNNHFEVIFQPIFSLSDGALLRMEAFVRWVHPGLGVLPPGAFISFFENQGRMNELTRYVIKRALREYKAWRGSNGPGFSVNLAFSDLTDDTFPTWLSGLLTHEEFDPKLMTLECPNAPANVSIENAAVCFANLKKVGTRLAVEVRGRANDVLREIKPFPFDEVKTGGSAILRFARTVRGGPGLTAISELLELAHANNACTVAVGVEDQASLQALASLGFMAAQGNYLAGVGEANTFQIGCINEVRSALSLDALTDAQLNTMMGKPEGAPTPGPVVLEDDESDEEPESLLLDKPADEAKAAQARLDAAKAARLKKRKAQMVAKQRAMKKATALRAAAEKAQIELEQKQRRLTEAAAKRDAEENARKLQERLTQTYEDPLTEEIPVVDETPTSSEGDDTAPEAGLLLGGPLANSALGRNTVEAVAITTADVLSEEPNPGDIELEAISDDVDNEISQTEPAEPTVAETNSDEAPSEASKSSLMTMPVSSDLNLAGIETETTEVSLSEVALRDITPEDEFTVKFAEAGAFPADAVDTPRPEKIFTKNFVFQPVHEWSVAPEEVELRSEDEILDEAFQDTEELDPTGLHDEHIDDLLELDSTERHIAEKLLRPAVTVKRKNFFQRKFRITHFWPRTWKRKWQTTKAAQDAEEWLDTGAELDLPESLRASRP